MTRFGSICERCLKPYLNSVWCQPWLCLECRRGMAFYKAFELVKRGAA